MCGGWIQSETQLAVLEFSSAIADPSMKTVLYSTLILFLTPFVAAFQKDSEYPTPLVREQRQIVVNGASEIWQLQWISPPTPYCEPTDTSLTCPCTGFAYGEAGDLVLMRFRNGSEIDRLHLTPLFTEEPQAVLQRWPANDETDFKLAERDDFPKLVSQRQTVQVMHFGDYDHDGSETEFYLQTDAAPCGKSAGVVIGISKSNPRLHVFGTASNPGKPLYLFKWEWDALRNTASGTTKVMDWRCGDHGADIQTELELHWSAQGISGMRREYTCPSKNESRDLVREEPF